MEMKIKRLHKNFKAPVYSTLGAAAFDIHAVEDITVNIHPVEINLGFAAEVPEGHVALLIPRSGMGFRYGFSQRNTVGVIDSDYRGEWKAKVSIDLFNGHTYEDKMMKEVELDIKAGDRILQCLIVPVVQVDFRIVNELSETERGSGGIGSTGK